MSLKKRSNAYFSLAQMTAAGMSIVRSTRMVGTGIKGRIGRAMVRVSTDIERDGMLLSEAMRKHPRIFPPMDVIVVEVSDNSGNLPEGLRMLAGWYELIGRIRSIILSGMIFPIAMLNIAAFVFPLPDLVTSGFNLQRYLGIAVAVLLAFYVPIIVVVLLVRLSGSHGKVRRALDHVVYYVPVLGGAVRAMALSRYCMAFGMMARSGTSVITTARSAAELCGNALMEKRLIGGADSARAGNPVVDGFRDLPFEFVEMWRIGEETGDIVTVTTRMARTYEEQMVFRFTAVAKAIPWILYAMVSIMIIIMVFMLASRITGTITGLMNDI
jgi:type IV pilus assembly protein PilC